MAVRALVFDMDGTMIDSMGCHAQSWAVFTQRHGIPLGTAEVLRLTTGRTGVEAVRLLFARDLSDADAQDLLHEKESVYRELFAPQFREVAGFSAFAAQAAAQGLRIGVGTAGDRHNIAFAMGHLRMQPPPQAIVGGDEGLAGKPEPAIFLEVARRLGVAPHECIVFEDAPLGIEAARRAGMAAVAVCTSHSAEQLAGPHVLEAVSDYHPLGTSGFLARIALETQDA
jgi:beta-phosphoglucomutase-like phosphatase (HAD superfamily)